MKIYFKNGMIVVLNIPKENKEDVLIVEFDEKKNLMHFKQEEIKGNAYYTRMTAVASEVVFIDYESDKEEGKMMPLRIEGR